MIPYPKGKTRAKKYLIATVDLNRPQQKWLSSEMDTRLSKLIYADAPPPHTHTHTHTHTHKKNECR